MAYIGTQPQDVRTTANRSFTYSATSNQTSFTGADSNSKTLSYVVGEVEVFMNGIKLDSSDFTASNGTTVVLASGAAANDVVVIEAKQNVTLNTFTGLLNPEVIGSGTMTGNLTIAGNLSVTGTTVTVDTATVQTVDLGDNDKIRLGDGNDLWIYHDGSHSYIEDAGTGELRLRGNTSVKINQYNNLE